MKHGVQVNCESNRETCLFLALQMGYAIIAKVLLEHGASVTGQLRNGWSIMHAAAQMGDYGILKLLIDRVGNLNTRDYCGLTPIHVLVQSRPCPR